MTPADFLAIRIRLGLSQRELGRIIRLSDRQIRRIEKSEDWHEKKADIGEDVMTAMRELDAQFGMAGLD